MLEYRPLPWRVKPIRSLVQRWLFPCLWACVGNKSSPAEQHHDIDRPIVTATTNHASSSMRLVHLVTASRFTHTAIERVENHISRHAWRQDRQEVRVNCEWSAEGSKGGDICGEYLGQLYDYVIYVSRLDG